MGVGIPGCNACREEFQEQGGLPFKSVCFGETSSLSRVCAGRLAGAPNCACPPPENMDMMASELIWGMPCAALGAACRRRVYVARKRERERALRDLSLERRLFFWHTHAPWVATATERLPNCASKLGGGACCAYCGCCCCCCCAYCCCCCCCGGCCCCCAYCCCCGAPPARQSQKSRAHCLSLSLSLSCVRKALALSY